MNYTKLDSFDLLIRALETYQEEMRVNCNILTNAADVCDAAMGSDDISRKHIANLDDALVHLKKTIRLAEAMQESLRAEKRRLIDIYEA